MSFILRCFTTLIGLSISLSTAAEVRVIHAGSLLAVPGERVLRERTIVVEGEYIREIQQGFADPSAFGRNATLINLSDAFVLPGLMDMHVHLQGELGPENDAEDLKMSSQEIQMRSTMFGVRTLLAGFTTVRDVGNSGQEMYALRRGIEEGWVDGPRIVAAGSVGITGGHSDVSGVRPAFMKLLTSEQICDGPYDCRRATRNAIKFGADLIKITSTGGVMTDRATGTGQQMEMDELREVVRAAARMGRKVAAHAHEEDGIVAALEAGVHSIEHGSYTGDRAIALFLETGAYLVPTLLAGKTVATIAVEQSYMSPTIRDKAIRVGNDMANSFRRAHEAGVRIAYGTDSGISRHGRNAEEALLMVENGMSEMDVLVAATINAAELIDRSDDIGTIEVGKLADIIALDESPLENIEALLDVDFVMKGGLVYKNQ